MDNTNRLIGSLFENLAEVDWACDFLKGVCAATRSHAATVLSVDVPARRFTLPAYVGEGPSVARAFEQTHAAENPWGRLGPAHAAGSVVVPDDVLPLTSLRRTRFWTDFLRPMGVDHGCGLIGQRTPDRATSLTLLRSARVGAYDTQERAWLDELAGHWVTACRLRDRMSMPDRETWEAAQALDRLHTAAFFLDHTGRCTRWTPAADALLQAGDLVRLRAGRLVATCPGSGPAALGASGPVALRRRDGSVAAHASVHVLPGHGPMGAARSVVFVDLVGSRRPAEVRAALMAVYGLTVREAEMAARLAEGAGLPEVAEAMGISGTAARTRLKEVFGKMGVRGQGELVAVVVGLRRTVGKNP